MSLPRQSFLLSPSSDQGLNNGNHGFPSSLTPITPPLLSISPPPFLLFHLLSHRRLQFRIPMIPVMTEAFRRNISRYFYSSYFLFFLLSHIFPPIFSPHFLFHFVVYSHIVFTLGFPTLCSISPISFRFLLEYISMSTYITSY